MLDISKHQIQIPCPNCKAKVAVTLKQVSNKETVTCKSCKTNITLIDSEKSAKKGIEKFDKAFSDIKKIFRKSGK